MSEARDAAEICQSGVLKEQHLGGLLWGWAVASGPECMGTWLACEVRSGPARHALPGRMVTSCRGSGFPT